MEGGTGHVCVTLWSPRKATNISTFACQAKCRTLIDSSQTRENFLPGSCWFFILKLLLDIFYSKIFPKGNTVCSFSHLGTVVDTNTWHSRKFWEFFLVTMAERSIVWSAHYSGKKMMTLRFTFRILRWTSVLFAIFCIQFEELRCTVGFWF